MPLFKKTFKTKRKKLDFERDSEGRLKSKETKKPKSELELKKRQLKAKKELYIRNKAREKRQAKLLYEKLCVFFPKSEIREAKKYKLQISLTNKKLDYFKFNYIYKLDEIFSNNYSKKILDTYSNYLKKENKSYRDLTKGDVKYFIDYFSKYS